MNDFLIFGLGNVGEKYRYTRHNIGFLVLDYLVNSLVSSFCSVKYADVCQCQIGDKKVLLIKPSTFMNNSGKSVQYWMQKKKVPLSNILVITDDINLPFARFRIKSQGSSGGHNGLTNISEKIGMNYPRFRFGVGNSFESGNQARYVLSTWSEEEKDRLKPKLIEAQKAIESFVEQGIDKTMNTFNSF